MCVLFVAWQIRPETPLVVASNRDESYQRPTAPLAWWEDCPDVLAGRDLQAGGTWTGVTASGRWAAITNIRAPEYLQAQAPRSRGDLVRNYLCGTEPPAAYAAAILAERAAYGGFNLLLADGASLYYVSSRSEAPLALEPGFYGLSNGTLGELWPKVAHGGRAFRAWVEDGAREEGDLFALMQDEERAPDELLPETGVGIEYERLLSPLFIRGDAYGTRATTLLTRRADGHVRVVERTYGPGGKTRETRVEEFVLQEA